MYSVINSLASSLITSTYLLLQNIICHNIKQVCVIEHHLLNWSANMGSNFQSYLPNYTTFNISWLWELQISFCCFLRFNQYLPILFEALLWIWKVENVTYRNFPWPIPIPIPIPTYSIPTLQSYSSRHNPEQN